jgi:hypothetical protein
LLSAASSLAQECVPPGVICRPLPPTVYFLGPGTVYSAGVHADADFVRAVGSLRVDSAIAWSIAEDAYHKRLDNSVLDVRTSFERRLLNRQYLQLLYPSQEQRWGELERRYTERVERLSYELLKRGTITEELNWLLIRVFERRMSQSGDILQLVTESPGRSDPELDNERLAHIWLTDRPNGAGSKFRAHERIPLREPWPYLLQGPVFDDVRAEFEKCRDAALEQGRQEGRVDYQHKQALNSALDALLQRFERECRERLGTPDGPGRGEYYIQASGFVHGLRVQVQRFVKMSDQRLPCQFDGNRLSQLIDHMGAGGLYFAPPSDGDEGTYQQLFLALREMYLQGAARQGTQTEF